MSLVAVNTTPTRCPDCDDRLSMPIASKARPGMVIQTCRNNYCLRSVWSAVGEPKLEPVIDDGRRHGRMFQQEAQPRLVAPNRWKRFSDAELEVVNQHDRKLAAAGGER